MYQMVVALGDGAPAAPTGVTGVVPAGLWESWAAKKIHFHGSWDMASVFVQWQEGEEVF